MFKKGDTVRCIDQGNYAYVKEGEVFTVEAADGGYITLLNNLDELYAYNAKHFEPAVWEPQCGDTILVPTSTTNYAMRYFIGYTKNGNVVYEDRDGTIWQTAKNSIMQYTPKTIVIDGKNYAISQEALEQIKALLNELP